MPLCQQRWPVNVFTTAMSSSPSMALQHKFVVDPPIFPPKPNLAEPYHCANSVIQLMFEQLSSKPLRHQCWPVNASTTVMPSAPSTALWHTSVTDSQLFSPRPNQAEQYPRTNGVIQPMFEHRFPCHSTNRH